MFFPWVGGAWSFRACLRADTPPQTVAARPRMGDPSRLASARYGGPGSPAPIPRQRAMERTDQHRSGRACVNPRSSMLRADAERGAPFGVPPNTRVSWDNELRALLAARQ